MGWQQVADGIIHGIEKTISNKTLTYDFAWLMAGAKLLRCSEFAFPQHAFKERPRYRQRC